MSFFLNCKSFFTNVENMHYKQVFGVFRKVLYKCNIIIIIIIFIVVVTSLS